METLIAYPSTYSYKLTYNGVLNCYFFRGTPVRKRFRGA